MRKYFVTPFVTVLFVSYLGAQDPAGSTDTPEQLFSIVEEHNLALQTAMKTKEAVQLQARTGNAPSDPTIEMGYMNGRPDDLGNRLDFRVSQEIDFPTTYFQRAKLRDLQITEAEYYYQLQRQEVLARAMELFLERVSLNQQSAMVGERMQKAEKMASHYQQMMEAGEVSILSVSQVNLQTVELNRIFSTIQTRIRTNQEAIDALTNGNSGPINVDIFPDASLPPVDALLAQWKEGPEQKIYEEQIRMKETEQRLALGEGLPKISGGYYSESVVDERFSGIHLGVSIPLWANANRVKYARAETEAITAGQAEFIRQQQSDIRQKIEEYNNLLMQAQDLEEALGSINDLELLERSLELGEISLSEFIFASENYFRNRQKLVELKHNQLLLKNELVKVMY